MLEAIIKNGVGERLEKIKQCEHAFVKNVTDMLKIRVIYLSLSRKHLLR